MPRFNTFIRQFQRFFFCKFIYRMHNGTFYTAIKTHVSIPRSKLMWYAYALRHRALAATWMANEMESAVLTLRLRSIVWKLHGGFWYSAIICQIVLIFVIIISSFALLPTLIIATSFEACRLQLKNKHHFDTEAEIWYVTIKQNRKRSEKKHGN